MNTSQQTFNAPRVTRRVASFAAVGLFVLLAGVGCDLSRSPKTNTKTVFYDDDSKSENKGDGSTTKDAVRLYSNQRLGIQFLVPSTWHTTEFTDDVLVAEDSFPDPLPPDFLLRIPIVVSVNGRSPDVEYQYARSQDPDATIESGVHGSKDAWKIVFREEGEPVVVFVIKRNNKFIHVFATVPTDSAEVSTLVESLIEGLK